MDVTQLKLIQSVFVFLALTLLFYIYRGLKIGLEISGYPEKRRKKILFIFLAAIIIWILTVSGLSIFKFFLDFQAMPPRLLYAFFIPLCFILYFTFSSKLNKVLIATPVWPLIYIQAYRVVVEILRWVLMLLKVVPVQMSFAGSNFDIIAGVTAPLIAYFCYQRKNWAYNLALIWNFAGLALLINRFIIGLYSMPTSFQMYHDGPAYTLTAYFPMIISPAVLVPIGYAMHMFSIKQILLKKKNAVQLTLAG